MVKRKGVSLIVDENFFRDFEKGRQREQIRLRRKFGGMFNLSQRNFTAMLSAKKFRFEIPKQQALRSSNLLARLRRLK